MPHFIAHGKTTFDLKHQKQGWTKKHMLPSERPKAEKAATQLAGLENPPKSVLSSDLPRAVDTAKIIGNKLGVEPSVTPALRPQNPGDFVGQPEPSVDRKMKTLNKTNSPIPGGERKSVYQKRFQKGLKRARPDSVVVTHSSNIRDVTGRKPKALKVVKHV